MPRSFRQAHIRNWRGKPYLIYHDHTKPGAPERRLSCESLKATTKEARAELVKKYSTQGKLDEVEAIKRGGAFDYDGSLLKCLDEFLKRCDLRVETLKANPLARKQGLRPKTAAMLHESVERFKKWLTDKGHGGITTGQLTKDILDTCFMEYAATPGRLGKKTRPRSPATVSLYQRNVRAALRFINGRRPRRFPDFEDLADALKPGGASAGKPKAFEPKELVQFIETAIEREQPGRVVKIVGSKPGQREREGYEQPLTEKANTPVSRLFLLLALTGMRLGEALALKWSDVDLERGRVTVYAMKTNRERTLPLIDRTGDEKHVAPRFLELLRLWKLEAGGREHVLPHVELPEPSYPKSAWQGANTAAKVRRIGPQHLRQNFCSYACSLGVDEGIAALWQGHSPTVARAYYRAQVLDRQAGKTFEQAMGLLPIIERLLKSKSGARVHQMPVAMGA